MFPIELSCLKDRSSHMTQSTTADSTRSPQPGLDRIGVAATLREDLEQHRVRGEKEARELLPLPFQVAL